MLLIVGSHGTLPRVGEGSMGWSENFIGFYWGELVKKFLHFLGCVSTH